MSDCPEKNNIKDTNLLSIVPSIVEANVTMHTQRIKHNLKHQEQGKPTTGLVLAGVGLENMFIALGTYLH